jgi:hypothetical protein
MRPNDCRPHLLVSQSRSASSRQGHRSWCLVKDMALEDILTSIRVVTGGGTLITPGVTTASDRPVSRPGR